MPKILCVGDLHLREKLTYSEYIKDGRESERKNILDAIIEASKDCDSVVLLGDIFNNKNPSAETVASFVNFIERFRDKEVFMISGNHSKKGDGSTALDFINEITGKPNWHLYTKPTGIVDIKDTKAFFLPYMFKSELGVSTDEEAAKKLLKMIPKCDLLFLHHSVSDTMMNDGSIAGSTNIFREIILSKEELEKKVKFIFSGHVHYPKRYGNVINAGSVFTSMVGETEKFIFKFDTNKRLIDPVETIRLPGRHIYKLENPSIEDFSNYPKSSIMKVMLTDKNISVENTRGAMKGFDAHILVEDYPNERKKIDTEGALDFSIESLLEVYSKVKEVDITLLKEGFELIK